MSKPAKKCAAKVPAAPAPCGASPKVSVTLQLVGGVSIAPLKPADLRRLVRAAVIPAKAPVKTSPNTSFDVTLRFVGRREAHELNLAYRQGDYAPNVLTFDYPGSATADIVICTPVVRDQASEQRKTYRQHLAHMVVHGVLHAQGHTHDKSRPARLMEDLERNILAGFAIPDPYQSLSAGSVT